MFVTLGGWGPSDMLRGSMSSLVFTTRMTPCTALAGLLCICFRQHGPIGIITCVYSVHMRRERQLILPDRAGTNHCLARSTLSQMPPGKLVLYICMMYCSVPNFVLTGYYRCAIGTRVLCGLGPLPVRMAGISTHDVLQRILASSLFRLRRLLATHKLAQEQHPIQRMHYSKVPTVEET